MQGWLERWLRPWYLAWVCFHPFSGPGEHQGHAKTKSSLLLCFPHPTGDSWDTRTQRQQGECQSARQVTSSQDPGVAMGHPLPFPGSLSLSPSRCFIPLLPSSPSSPSLPEHPPERAAESQWKCLLTLSVAFKSVSSLSTIIPRGVLAPSKTFFVFVLQGEVGVGAAGPKGPRGLPGPQVGPSKHAPCLARYKLPSSGGNIIPSPPAHSTQRMPEEPSLIK